MTHDDPSLLRRVVGLLLIIMGLVFFSALLPFVVPLGLSGAVLLTWLVAICVGLGVFLLLRVGLRNATKSLLVVLALSLPWFAIFVIPIPSDAQLMFSVFVAFVALFVYRYYTKRHSSPKKLDKASNMRKVAGVALIALSLPSYVIAFLVVFQYSLFLAMIVSLPIFFVVLFGCSLIFGGGLKRAALWWLLFTAVTILPWIAVLPVSWQLVSCVLLAAIIISVLISYRRKLGL